MPKISNKVYVVKVGDKYYKETKNNHKLINNINDATTFEDFTDMQGFTGYDYLIGMILNKEYPNEDVRAIEVIKDSKCVEVAGSEVRHTR